jgi:4-diphosphocytidyl-2-C-methyl-D-erythritol kinase
MKQLYEVAAPAKLNLFLHVVGRRADGYHLLQSAMVLIDWCDTLHFERRSDGHLARHDLGASLPAEDLCLRAARALQAASTTHWGADISIDKQIPWGAGMGGGSSDAASTLLALNRLWQLHWPLSRLMSLGLSLGADVPFFLGCHPAALAEGIGEKLTPLALPSRTFAVVKPPVHLLTQEVFQSPLLVPRPEADIVTGYLVNNFTAWWVSSGVSAVVGDLFGTNDLEPVVQNRCPQVLESASWLAQRFGNSRMTGSGSAVFSMVGAEGLPDQDLRKIVLARRIDDTVPGYGVRMITTTPERFCASPTDQGLRKIVLARRIDDTVPGYGEEITTTPERFCASPTDVSLAGLPPQWVGKGCRSLHQHPLTGWVESD